MQKVEDLIYKTFEVWQNEIIARANSKDQNVSNKIPNSIIIDTIIALGYKAEDPVVFDFIDSVKYFRDKNEVLHVPKRKLVDIIHLNEF